jgi:hypothetical protein
MSLKCNKCKKDIMEDEKIWCEQCINEEHNKVIEDKTKVKEQVKIIENKIGELTRILEIYRNKDINTFKDDKPYA